jgi:GT2 family glycosyltransferase
MNRLTIVIVSYNIRQELDRCLQALHDPPPHVSHSIVVVDNASSDDTRAMLRQRWPSVHLIEMDSNLGFARAMNHGIAASQSELVLMLNGDTLPTSRAIERLIKVLDDRENTAAVGPLLVDADGRIEPSFSPMLGLGVEFQRSLLGRLYANGNKWAENHVLRRSSCSRSVDWVSGACLMVRRLEAESVGLLDERYFMYFEDVDFCAALRSLGKQIRFVSESSVTHLRGRSAKTVPDKMTPVYRRSHLRFYEKHHPISAWFLRIYLWIRGELPRT